MRADGSVTVDEVRYYMNAKLAGQRIHLVVDAPEQVFDLMQGATCIKRVPIKGLYGKLLPFEEYVRLMRKARTLRRASAEAEVPGSVPGKPVGVNGASLLGSLFFSTTPLAWCDLRLPCKRREAVLLGPLHRRCGQLLLLFLSPSASSSGFLIA